ncbi:MAG: alpha-amylase family glycosyl hydrolase [Nitriliruptorales bacterium]|nr:alpha-amylase family glycosyl hydrolase [Nitriliruptorales bacterium]
MAWWDGSVGYEIYLRSFQDSDGDGVGDLEGIRTRLGYLEKLGVDLVWITPFYPSPGADHGYDVADYTGVDPLFGALEDVERLVDEAHERDLRVIVDLVPNHSSDRHPWFQAARSDPDSPYRDYYVWRDPAPDGGPPNNWVSHFGGPAWTFDERSGQYYLHLFLPEQPDLNWANPDVADEFDRILEFWFELGIDGFRIDVAHAVVHDTEYRDNPLVGDPPEADAHPSVVFDAYEHRYDQDRPEVLDVYRRWRSLAERHDALLLGEVYLLEPSELTRYVADQDGLHSAFCFPALRTAWDPEDIRTTLTAAVDAGAGALSWPLSSHDDPRAATRFGGGESGARRARAYFALLAGLPGIPFLYMGDELGLDDGELAADEVADPVAVRNEGQTGRDGSRTPMIWEPGDGFGFTAGEPWLPFGRNRSDEQTVAAQRGDPTSHLEAMRALLRARRSLLDLAAGGSVEWIGGSSVVAYRRGDALVACNVGGAPAVLETGAAVDVLHLTTPDETAQMDGGTMTVPADTTVYAAVTPG